MIYTGRSCLHENNTMGYMVFSFFFLFWVSGMPSGFKYPGYLLFIEKQDDGDPISKNTEEQGCQKV